MSYISFMVLCIIAEHIGTFLLLWFVIKKVFKRDKNVWDTIYITLTLMEFGIILYASNDSQMFQNYGLQKIICLNAFMNLIFWGIKSTLEVMKTNA